MRVYKIGVIFSLLASAYLLATSIQIHSLPDFITIVAETQTSVVRIEVNRENKDEDDISGSLGSGFLISHDGYIITNHHVVGGADDVRVTLYDKRQLPAEIVGTDELTDIALLKIDGEGYSPVEVGSTYNLVVGQWVLAIGSPYGHDYTATVGIISTVRRYTDDLYIPFIQTDVAINPGNSGGPLFDGDGKVIGINSQIFSVTGNSAGISYSIPIDLAMTVVEQLKGNGHFIRGLLGATTENIDINKIEMYNLQGYYGALITAVTDKSSADRAGLEVGDVIVSFNGFDVDKGAALAPVVGLAPVEAPVSMVVLRGTERINLVVFLDPK